jgi:hypothetical protein
MEKVLNDYEDLLQAYKRLEAKYADLEAENRRLLEAEAERLEYTVDVEVVDLRARVQGYELRRQEMLRLLQREV